jgi:hypothetical protein
MRDAAEDSQSSCARWLVAACCMSLCAPGCKRAELPRQMAEAGAAPALRARLSEDARLNLDAFSDDKSPVADAQLDAAGTTGDYGRIGKVAFPGLGDDWDIGIAARAPVGLWLGFAARKGRVPIEPWPDVRVALVREADGLERASAGQVPEREVSCEASEGMLERWYRVEFVPAFEDLVAGDTLLPLNVTCYREWMGAQLERSYLFLFHDEDGVMREVLHVQTEDESYDKVAGTTKRSLHTLKISAPGQTAARVCVCKTTPPSVQVALDAAPRLGPCGLCYDWSGGRFVAEPGR